MPKKFTLTDFIQRATEVHGSLYDYSNVVYTNMHTKVNIIDPVYGAFWQTPYGHIHQAQGNPKRGNAKKGEARRMGAEEFIRLAKEKHGDLYDYSKVVYTHCDHKVCIIDPEYGEFLQSPYQHLRSHGCPTRTANRENFVDMDHVIPLSIIYSRKSKHSEWVKDRPLFKFLNSDLNLKPVSPRFNKDKSDTIDINGKKVSASSVRNNYDVISRLIQTELGVDPTDVILADQKYVRDFLR